MRTSSIRLRAHSRIAVLYEDYLEICDGNMLAAMLLSTLVYWTDVKTAQKDENLWIWKTHEGFQEDLMFDKPGMKPPHRTTISSALELLKRKDFIEWRKNPKMALDRTRQYLVHLEKVQASIDKLPALESRKSDKGMSENRLSEEQATEASSEQSSNVGKPTMQSRNNDNALSEKRHSNVGKPTSNTSDYSYSDYSPVITGEGTYSASGQQEQPCADAPTPSVSSDSYSLTKTEDTNGPKPSQSSSDNHSHPGVRSGAHDARGEGDQAPQGAQTTNAQDRSHAAGSQGHTTTGVTGGGSGYQKPQQQTLTGVSQQDSVHRAPVDVTKLTIQAHINFAFKWLDAVRQKAEKNPQASYVQSRTAEKSVRELIEATMNTPNELTEQNIYIAWMAMWKSPAGKDGFTWGKPGAISIAAFCRNYGEYLARGRDSLVKAQQRSQSASVPSIPAVVGVSGRRKMDIVPPVGAR